eukprot:gene20814-biopygen22141
MFGIEPRRFLAPQRANYVEVLLPWSIASFFRFRQPDAENELKCAVGKLDYSLSPSVSSGPTLRAPGA